MRALVRVLFVATALIFIPSPASAAEELSVPDILELGAELAGEEIAVEGELVGDYGFRADGSMWTQLNDDPYVDQPLREGGTPKGANTGIAVTMPADRAKNLDDPGGYRIRGPVVRVTGIWKYHDPGRQGESYLEVQSLTVTEPARQLDEQVNWIVVILGAVFLAGAGAIALLKPGAD